MQSVNIMNEPNFNVHLASHYGVCFGVRDAIDATRKTFNDDEVTVLGQLVHNPIVNDELKRNHVRSGKLRDPSEDITGTVIITAHGASNIDKDAWRSPNRKVVDTTCPLVRKAHDNLSKLVELGYFPVVIGRKGHVEVEGLVGDFPQALVIEKSSDLEKLPDVKKIGAVSQTTQRSDYVDGVIESIRSHSPEAEVKFIDTICSPTKNRQKSVRELAEFCDVVVVVGGANSNNTRQLVTTVEELGPRAIHIQKASDLDADWFEACSEVGLTAGTSTLKETVQGVLEKLKLIALDIYSDKLEKIAS